MEQELVRGLVDELLKKQENSFVHSGLLTRVSARKSTILTKKQLRLNKNRHQAILNELRAGFEKDFGKRFPGVPIPKKISDLALANLKKEFNQEKGMKAAVWKMILDGEVKEGANVLKSWAGKANAYFVTSVDAANVTPGPGNRWEPVVAKSDNRVGNNNGSAKGWIPGHAKGYNGHTWSPADEVKRPYLLISASSLEKNTDTIQSAFKKGVKALNSILIDRAGAPAPSDLRDIGLRLPKKAYGLLTNTDPHLTQKSADDIAVKGLWKSLSFPDKDDVTPCYVDSSAIDRPFKDHGGITYMVLSQEELNLVCTGEYSVARFQPTEKPK